MPFAPRGAAPACRVGKRQPTPLATPRKKKKKTQQSRANSAARAALGRPCSWLCMRTSTANLGRPCRARRVWFQGLGTKGHGGSKRGSLERAGCDAANNCGPLKCPSGAECSPNAWRLTKRCITSTVPRGQCLRGRKAHKCGHRNCDSPSQPTHIYTMIKLRPALPCRLSLSRHIHTHH